MEDQGKAGDSVTPDVAPEASQLKQERRRGRFIAGASGNPAGKRPGTRNRATLAVERMLDGEADALTRKAIELALGGDTVALRMCLERIAPLRKGRPVMFDLPHLETSNDIVTALRSLVGAVAQGEVTPDEAASVAAILETTRRSIEQVDIERRLTELENNSAKS